MLVLSHYARLWCSLSLLVLTHRHRTVKSHAHAHCRRWWVSWKWYHRFLLDHCETAVSTLSFISIVDFDGVSFSAAPVPFCFRSFVGLYDFSSHLCCSVTPLAVHFWLCGFCSCRRRDMDLQADRQKPGQGHISGSEPAWSAGSWRREWGNKSTESEAEKAKKTDESYHSTVCWRNEMNYQMELSLSRAGTGSRVTGSTILTGSGQVSGQGFYV